MSVAGSRTFLCYEDGLTSTGEIVPRNPPCQAAVARAGTTPLYNWFAVGNRSGATSGNTTGFIPDGNLCGGNSNYCNFSGFDLARADWPKDAPDVRILHPDPVQQVGRPPGDVATLRDHGGLGPEPTVDLGREATINSAWNGAMSQAESLTAGTVPTSPGT